ncbi:MAG: hypothetical protein JWO83_357 [Caulobacteraceae bacterium]|nr:hypothetical protein [Caulobacteraceae bacterium]
MRLLVLDANEPRGRKINGHNTIYPRHAASFLSDPRWTAIAPGLIAASEASRDWRRRKRTGKLLYGYGLFQNDLQNIQDKRFTHFWTDAAPPIKGMDLTGQTGLWADVGVCADVFLSELEDKYAVTKDIWKAAEAYNGTGPSAEIYIANVRNYEAAIRRKGVQ